MIPGAEGDSTSLFNVCVCSAPCHTPVALPAVRITCATTPPTWAGNSALSSAHSKGEWASLGCAMRVAKTGEGVQLDEGATLIESLTLPILPPAVKECVFSVRIRSVGSGYGPTSNNFAQQSAPTPGEWSCPHDTGSPKGHCGLTHAQPLPSRVTCARSHCYNYIYPRAKYCSDACERFTA